MRFDVRWKKIGRKRGGQRSIGRQYAWHAGFGMRDERAGRAEVRTRDAADDFQFGQRRKGRLAVGVARGGRRVAGPGDEHTEPHGRIPQ
ncbi:hypothetical protein WN989_22520 [Burkholderia arboris]